MSHKFFIIAGEPSGDIIGENLIRSLKLLSPDSQIYGVGGNKMISQGLKSLFPIDEISLMGYAEILPKIFKIKKLIQQTYEAIIKTQPDIIVTIDSPGFNYRVVKLVRQKFGNQIKIINYVAPSVWAYKPKRVHKVKKLYDHQLLIFPFEKPYFDAVSMPATYVGHPTFEKSINTNYEKLQVFKKHNIPSDNMLITLMPGSRIGELKNHLPIFFQALNLLKQEVPNFSIFIPTLAHLEDYLRNKLQDLKIQTIITSSLQGKEELLAVSDVALVKSGTSTLELSRFRLPMVVAYKLSAITAFILSFFIKTKFFSLSNIVLNEEVVPEFIQGQCNPENIKEGILNLIHNESLKRYQQDKFIKISKIFNEIPEPPSIMAAKKIMEYLK